jgi:hypothetical protein
MARGIVSILKLDWKRQDFKVKKGLKYLKPIKEV